MTDVYPTPTTNTDMRNAIYYVKDYTNKKANFYMILHKYIIFQWLLQTNTSKLDILFYERFNEKKKDVVPKTTGRNQTQFSPSAIPSTAWSLDCINLNNLHTIIMIQIFKRISKYHRWTRDEFDSVWVMTI